MKLTTRMRNLSRIASLALALAISAQSAWIWSSAEEIAPPNRFTYFRRVFTLDRIPESPVLEFAADSNARIWINGHLLSRKVTRYFEDRATVDAVDATGVLHTGQNVIVVLHHNWGPIITFQRSANRHAGLYIESAWLRTDSAWRWLAAPEFAPHHEQIVGITGDHRIRYPQIVDGARMLPDAIHSREFDDSAWQHAREVADGPWPARPARTEIPPQRESVVRPARVLASGRLIPSQAVSNDPLSIASGIRTAGCEPVPSTEPQIIEARAGESRYVTFDYQRPVHGYPFLDLGEAPEGTVIDFGYAENPYLQYSGERQVQTNGCLDPEAVVGRGYADRYLTQAGSQHVEMPDERTVRWLTLHIHFAKSGRVVVKDSGIVESQYPVEQMGSFEAGDDRLEQIVRLCLIHARVTMVDGYVDTPGREDGTWIEDARIRAEIAARWFGDNELRRLTLRLHAESENQNGQFHCFPPSNYPLPACSYDWSVQWVAMLYDDYMWTGKTDLLLRYWDNLERFWNNTLANVDARGVWRTNRVFGDIRTGVHPTAKQSSGIVTPFLIERLRWSVQMAEAAGQKDTARRWRDTAARMSEAFLRDHVVPANGAIPAHVDDVFDGENPEAVRGFSQSAQAMAAVSGFPLKDALDYAYPAPDGTPPAGVTRWNNPTFAYRSVFALSENGFAARAVAHLIERYSPYLPGNPRNRVPLELQGPDGGPLPEYWISREDLQLKDGEPNPAQPVDDTGSHGWQSTPLLWLHDSLLGVRIIEPGGARLHVEPRLAGLPYVAGHTMTPRGLVWVHWNGRKLDLRLPPGVTAEVALPGRPLEIVSGSEPRKVSAERQVQTDRNPREH